MTIEMVLDARAKVGEAATWCDRTNVLWWVDIGNAQVRRYDPATGADDHWAFDEPVGCLGLCDSADLVLGLKSGFARFDPASGTHTFLAKLSNKDAADRLNDGAVSFDGRFFAGMMTSANPRTPTAALYRFDPDGTATRLFEGEKVINGIAFSPDNTVMYMSDSDPDRRTIWRFDYDAVTGVISNRTVFFDTSAVRGRPDGAAVDADGCYWMAGVGGSELVRLTPAGAVDRRIDMPCERPSKVSFGGPDLKTLYVTSIGVGSDRAEDGALYALRPGVSGLGTARIPLTL